MHRTLEMIFGQWRRLLALLILLPIVSLAVVLTMPRTYLASASLWALRRYEVIGATGVESDLQSTPAQTQATALTEMLQTRAFALGIAESTGLPATFPATLTGSALDDALVSEVSQHVQVTPQGYNLLTVTYQNRSPQVAQQVVQAVIAAFSEQSGFFSVVAGKQLLATYQAQLATAEQTAKAAEAAQALYAAQHPTLSPVMLQSDPQYGALQANTQQAQAVVQQLQTEIATVNQDIAALQGSGSNTLFNEVDAPVLPDRPVSRTKLLLLGGVVGLLGSLIACAAYLIVAFRRSQVLYSALDVARVTSLSVLGQLPDVPSLGQAPVSVVEESVLVDTTPSDRKHTTWSPVQPSTPSQPVRQLRHPHKREGSVASA
jgi:uncharacterized protein involved in exopolysaccharide biosynthesis